MKVYAAIQVFDELTIHLPGADGTGAYFTLCGMDIDENPAIQHYEAVINDSKAKVNCRGCFSVWRLAQLYSARDFEVVA